MPSLADFQSTSIKMLLCGKPGTGKTGSLVSILDADPEARLFICNFDKGNIGTLLNVARFNPANGQPRPNAAAILSRIQYHDFQDPVKSVNGIPMVVGTPSAFTGIGKVLNDWGDGFGGLSSWGPKDWLIVDSVTALGESALRYALNSNRRLNQRPQFEDYGEAINRIQLLLESINDVTVKANVCCITHVRYVGDLESAPDPKTGKPKELDALPSALGQKMPQEIGRYFNNIIQADTVGTGPGTQRKLFSRSPGKLVTRTSNPGRVKPEYDLISGMAELVKDLRSEGVPIPSPQSSQPGAPAPNPAAPAAQPK